jgi:catechol 2,3-dioxygenase-like lactoylglutathione lyase family enzyme
MPCVVRRCGVGLGLFLVVAGSGQATPRTLAAQGLGAGSPVTWIREIRLEESPAVINVAPVVRPDPRGGYLVADVREAQIRRYDEDGRLLWHVGRKGHGPEEFQAPQIALRLPDGNIFVADSDTKIAIFDSTGTHLLKSFLVPLQRMDDGAVLNDSLVLCSGMGGDGPPHAFLHVVNLNRETVTASFFRPFAHYLYPDLAVVFASVVLAFNGTEIAAAALPIDTVYFFDPQGRSLRRVHVPAKHFRTPKPIRPGDFRNPQKRAEWLGSFETLTGLYWVGRDTLLARLRTIVDTTFRWHLVAMTASGDGIFEWADSPELLGVDGDSGRLIFQSPRSITPNVWAIARLSP